ncbi:hypothetical protein THAOC_35398, partial [Thalassiosira oceanica]
MGDNVVDIADALRWSDNEHRRFQELLENGAALIPLSGCGNLTVGGSRRLCELAADQGMVAESTTQRQTTSGVTESTTTTSSVVHTPRPAPACCQRETVVYDVAHATPRNRGRSLDIPRAVNASRLTRSHRARSLGPASNSNGEENRGIYFELINHETVLRLAGEQLAGVTAELISDIINDAFSAVGYRTTKTFWKDYRETFEEEKTLAEEGGLGKFFARALGAICKDLKAAELVSTILFIALNKPSERTQSQTYEENLQACDRSEEFIRQLRVASSCPELSHCTASSLTSRTKKKGQRSYISASTLVKLMTRIAKGLNVHTDTYPHLTNLTKVYTAHRVELLLAQLTRNSLNGSEGKLFLKTLSGIDSLSARHLCGDNGCLPTNTDEKVYTCASFMCQRWGSPSQNKEDSVAFERVYRL